MNVIVDAQLPFKLCEILNQLGVNTIHVQDLPSGDETSDLEIIKYADKNKLIVRNYSITKTHFLATKT